jgi:hypothetical protein
MSRRPFQLLVLALLLGGVAPVGAAVRPAQPAPDCPEVTVGTLLAPRLPAPMTRLSATVRPFFSSPQLGMGVLTELALRHYFRVPLSLGVELRPVAVLANRDGTGAIGYAVGVFGYASRFLEIYITAGGQFQHHGVSGFSIGAGVRLGALDGLSLVFRYAHSLVRGPYSGELQLAVDHFIGELNFPLRPGLALLMHGGFGWNLWGYATLGMRHFLIGSGARRSLALHGGIGLALMVDRFPCQYADPTPCSDAARGIGPTLTVGLDARF